MKSDKTRNKKPTTESLESGKVEVHKAVGGSGKAQFERREVAGRLQLAAHGAAIARPPLMDLHPRFDPKGWALSWARALVSAGKGFVEIFSSGRIWIGFAAAVVIEAFILLAALGVFSRPKKAAEDWTGLTEVTSYDESLPPAARELISNDLKPLEQPPLDESVYEQSKMSSVSSTNDEGVTVVKGDVLVINPNAKLTTKQILEKDTVKAQAIGYGRIRRTIDDVNIPPVSAKKPQLVGKLDIKYPERMKALEISGLVIVAAALDEQGRVFDTRILKSSGYPELDTVAIQAVSRASFTPAIQGGKALAVKISVPVNFTLTE